MRRVVLAVAIGLAMLAVDGRPASAEPQRMVDAVVVLRDQADLSTIQVGSRAARLSAVVRTLRAKASSGQKGVLDLLARQRKLGLVETIRPLWIANEVEVRAAPSVIAQLAARPDIREIRPNLTIQAPAPPVSASTGPAPTGPAEPNLAVVNAPALWSLGFRGQGTVVASMDTGVDASHPDLAARWRGGTNSWFDPNGEHPAVPTDVNGHGTWTMGAMVGGDAGGTSLGVAPDAKWIAVKIFNDRGTSTSAMIHRGFQWLLDPDGNPATPDAPNVVNDSWTMSVSGCNLDFQPDLRSLRAAGILPVFAAGNFGPLPGTVLSPANNPEAFAVGATDNLDALDPSSGRGPSACAQATAPKLVAPGAGVRTTDLYGSYAQQSGTSMAAPHVAGALALLLGAFPGLSADRQEAALQSTAVDLGPAGPDGDYGSGRLDALAAYQWLGSAPDFALTVSPASVTTTPGGTATYSVSVAAVNGFAGDVSLSLAGLPPVQASWSFAPPVVQGGSGTSLLTVTTDATIPPGTYPLTITGASGPTTHTAAATLVVPAPPDFSLTATLASRTVAAGGTAAYTVGVGSLNGFAGDVALSLSGLPAAVGSATFTPAEVAGAGTSQLAVAVSQTAPAGTYTLTVTGASGARSHSAQVTLVVSPPPDFALSVSPASRSVPRGGSATWTVSVASLRGFTGSVGLSVQGLPSGVTATFSANPVVAPGSSTMTVRAGSRATRGTFTLVVTGSSGSTAHQATTTLTVR